jgi:hypothetical protein
MNFPYYGLVGLRQILHGARARDVEQVTPYDKVFWRLEKADNKRNVALFVS